MTKERAIPEGYITAGQLAKKMNTTVRTIQYYDQTGLLKPAATSEGGRRLYTDREIMRLHQIQSLQRLGFSLDDIGTRLSDLETPAEVEKALAAQENQLRAQIAELTEIASQISLLRAEVAAMDRVDFHKYADIVINLQMQNPYFWMLKYIDEETMDILRSRFDAAGAQRFIAELARLLAWAERMDMTGAVPGDEEPQRFAREYWDLILEFTNGDPRLMESLNRIRMKSPGSSEADARIFSFIERALEELFTQQEESHD